MRSEASENNDEENWSIGLLLLEERRERAGIKIKAQKISVQNTFNKTVKQRNFLVDDPLLRNVLGNWKAEKLAANWEKPYKVWKITKRWAYKLETLDGKEESLSWNVCHIQKYYQ